MTWRQTAAAGIERYAVADDEWVTVAAGYIMVVTGAALRVDGVVRLDGAVKVG